MNQPDDRLSPGALNAAISNEVVRLVADFTGRGATKSRAFIHQDVVVCLLENGATKAERNLGRPASPSWFASRATRSNERWRSSS